MRTRKRRWWRWILLAVVLMAAAFVITVWLMFQHVPSWYRPIAIAPGKEAQRVRNDLEYTQGVLTESFLRSETFEHVFTQDRVNRWLAAREEIWPESRKWLSKGASDPFVALEEQGIRLAATYQQGGVKTVVSAHLEIAHETDGIRVRLLDVATGELSVPDSWIRDKLAALDANGWPAGKTVRYQYGNQPLPPLSGLLEGILLPNEWIWWNGEQPFRIIGLRLDAGALTVEFEPLDPQSATR